MAGAISEGVAMAQAALDSALASGDRLTQGRARASLAAIAILQSDPELAVDLASEGLARDDMPADARAAAMIDPEIRAIFLAAPQQRAIAERRR